MQGIYSFISETNRVCRICSVNICHTSNNNNNNNNVRYQGATENSRTGHCANTSDSNGKGKGHPRTGHEGPEGK